MKPPMFTGEQAKKALDGVLKRYGIDPSQPPPKKPDKALHVSAVSPKVLPLPPLKPTLARRPQPPLVKAHGNLPGVASIDPGYGAEEKEFHYLVKVSSSALTFHFRTTARNATAAKRTMLDIPNLTRWSALLGEALMKVLADEQLMDLRALPAPI